jgi:peptidoglycan/LPS O-acetylase OafA/YrhL
MLHHAVLTQPEDDQWIPMMTRLYYPTYTRLDGLLCGLALATLRSFKPEWWKRAEAHGNVLLVAGLLVVTVGMAVFQFDYPSLGAPAGFLIGFPLVSFGFALLVAAAVCPRGVLTRRLPGANVVAALAFSLYLTHKSVAHVDALLLPWLKDHQDWVAAGIYAVTCFAIAAAIYFAVERPFLRLRDHRWNAARADVEARIYPAL